MSSNYTVPYSFIAGTKASAEEVNANFSHITDILSNIGVAKYPFCVNSAHRNDSGKEDLFFLDGDLNIAARVGSNYESLSYTTGFGVPKTVDKEIPSATVEPTTYGSVLPAMASSIHEGFTCIADSEESGRESWHAFDKNEDSFWGSFVGVTTASLTVALDARYVLSYYYLKVLTAASWKLEGSNDQKTWTTLDEYSTAEASTVTRSVDFKGNFQSYKITMTVLDDTYQVRIAEFDLYQESSTGTLRLPETQLLYISEDGVQAIRNKYFSQAMVPVGISRYSSAIPEMTSNLVPDGYQISASSYDVSCSPYLATDGREDTYWEATDKSNVWFQVQVPNPIEARVCKITQRPDHLAADQAIVNGYLLGSNNGINWDVLYEFKNISWTYGSESKYFYFTDNTVRYTYFRIQGEAPFASLGEFQLYVEDSDGEYILGEADVEDVWFSASEPFQGKIYKGSIGWQNFNAVPAGEVHLNAVGEVTDLITYIYNQNGYNINALTTKDFSGNIVTHDSYISHFGETGYVILPNSLIIQWGSASGDGYTLFPAAFPHMAFVVIPVPATSETTAQTVVTAKSKTQFRLNTRTANWETASSIQNYWIAIGW